VSAVVYTRVPDSLKQALEAHASERGLSLTRAVVELVERGLEQTADQPSSSELEQTRVQLKQAELGLQSATQRERLTARTYRALAERARHQLGSCPGCRHPLTGSDLLVSGRCPNCGKALTTLPLPAPRSGFDRDEYLALLGAVGVLVGLATTTNADSAD